MRIGIDVRAFHSSKYGGIVEYIKNLVPALIEQGTEHQFKIYTHSWRTPSQLIPQGRYKNVENYYIRYPQKFTTLSTYFLGKPHVDIKIGGVDVFFSPHILPIGLSASHIRHYITVHDLSFKRFPSFFDRKRKLWHASLNVSRQLQQCNGVITPSQFTKNDVTTFYNIDEQKVFVVPSGIPYQNITQPDAEKWRTLQNEFGIKTPYILSLCTLEPRKNITTLVRAFYLLKQHKQFASTYLVLAGPPGWLNKNITKEISASPVRDHIIVTGAIPADLHYEIYHQASLFVYPSFFEGFGFQPLEAMRAGTSTIVSMGSSMPEVVGGASVLVDTRDVEGLASVMQEVLSDTTLQQELVALGRARVQDFSWKKCAQKMLQIFTQPSTGW